MPILADQKYNGKVGPHSTVIETQTGTLGYQVMLECEDGTTSFTIWLTEKNREKAEKYFDLLGVSKESLKNPTYLEYGLGEEIEGKEVSFGTREEEYNGRRTIKVTWIGKKSNGRPSRAAAEFFGAAPDEITDDDIPF